MFSEIQCWQYCSSYLRVRPPALHICYDLSTLQSPVVTICTASLTFSNSTFCPHSVFMCFVWIWEQTVIISLYSINWPVCITYIYCLLRGTNQKIMNFVSKFCTVRYSDIKISRPSIQVTTVIILTSYSTNIQFLYYLYHNDEPAKLGDLLTHWCLSSSPA